MGQGKSSIRTLNHLTGTYWFFLVDWVPLCMIKEREGREVGIKHQDIHLLILFYYHDIHLPIQVQFLFITRIFIYGIPIPYNITKIFILPFYYQDIHLMNLSILLIIKIFIYLFFFVLRFNSINLYFPWSSSKRLRTVSADSFSGFFIKSSTASYKHTKAYQYHVTWYIII